MTTFGNRLDEIVRGFTADLIQVVEGEARRAEATRKLAEAHAVPVESTLRNSRSPASQGGVVGVRLVTTFRHPERNMYQVVLTRFEPESADERDPAGRARSRRR